MPKTHITRTYTHVDKKEKEKKKEKIYIETKIAMAEERNVCFLFVF